MYLAMINIHNNMYHSINLYIHSINPSIHRYGTYICRFFLTNGVCPFSLPPLLPPLILSDFLILEESILVTIQL